MDEYLLESKQKPTAPPSFAERRHSFISQSSYLVPHSNKITMGGNPRRNAFEYGVFITLTTTMAASYAFLIAYSGQRTPEGQRRGLPRVDLDAKVDVGEMWEEMKSVSKSMIWPSSSSSGRSGTRNNGGLGGSDIVSAQSLDSNQGDQQSKK